ncbi:unnamed protein product [Pedinophyceae sp. YPF-701]|nr:unnamed protein product [Pedinophyceae sp. YPF-701]
MGKKTKPEIDLAQVRKAVVALKKYAGKLQDEGSELLPDGDDFMSLQIALQKMPVTPRKDKPVRLPVPHPLYEVGGCEVCLIVKDHKGEGHALAKELHAQMQGTGITKIIGLSKLRTKYESFEAKRKLCASYEVFLADERVLPSLPKLLGKTFFRKKRQPVPVDLRGANWGAQVRKALGATYLYLSQGTCLSVRVARVKDGVDEAVENVAAVVEQACEKIPRKWDNVLALYLKLPGSAALPIYQTLPTPPTKIE